MPETDSPFHMQLNEGSGESYLPSKSSASVLGEDPKDSDLCVGVQAKVCYNPKYCPPGCPPKKDKCANRHPRLCLTVPDPVCFLSELAGCFLLGVIIIGTLLKACDTNVNPFLLCVTAAILAAMAVFSVCAAGICKCRSSFYTPATITDMLLGEIGIIDGLTAIVAHAIGWILAGLFLWVFYTSTTCDFGTPMAYTGRNAVVVVPGVELSKGLALIMEVFIGVAFVVGSHSIARCTSKPCFPTAVLFGILYFIAFNVSGSVFHFWRYVASSIISGIWDCWWIYLVATFVVPFISAGLIYLVPKCGDLLAGCCPRNSKNHCN